VTEGADERVVLWRCPECGDVFQGQPKDSCPVTGEPARAEQVEYVPARSYEKERLRHRADLSESNRLRQGVEARARSYEERIEAVKRWAHKRRAIFGEADPATEVFDVLAPDQGTDDG
jgi:hypothetical protein